MFQNTQDTDCCFPSIESFLFLGKVKGEARPGKGHEGPEVEKRYRSTHWKKTRYPMHRGLHGSQWQSGRDTIPAPYSQ